MSSNTMAGDNYLDTFSNLTTISGGNSFATNNTVLSPYKLTSSYYQITPNVSLHSNGIDLKDGADIRVNGDSLLDNIQKINERLNILRPNPHLENTWQELKELGDKYRALEAELLEKERVWQILKK